jgi:hypothetical protein
MTGKTTTVTQVESGWDLNDILGVLVFLNHVEDTPSASSVESLDSL